MALSSTTIEYVAFNTIYKVALFLAKLTNNLELRRFIYNIEKGYNNLYNAIPLFTDLDNTNSIREKKRYNRVTR